MTGTIVNTIAVIAGSIIGLLAGKGLEENMKQSVTYMLGLATCVIGGCGLITTMITVGPEGKLSSSGELLLLVSLAVGAVLGEYLKIDSRLDSLGERIEAKFGAGDFSKGFISASVLFCVGAMTIMGSFNDGLTGDSSILFVKSALDFVASIVLASTLGPGVLFAAVTVLAVQGTLSLGAGFLASLLAGELLSQLCMVGYGVVLCIGINFFEGVKIKTANLIPALLIPIVYNMLLMLKNLW